MLPALEICYSMSQRFLDEHHQLAKPDDAPPALAPASPALPIVQPTRRSPAPGTARMR
ncbi:hypothetical protein ACP4OV_014086 [Aristida adscensionis]